MKLDYKSIITKHYLLHLSSREIAEQIGASKSGVTGFLSAFERAKGIGYPLPHDITNEGICELVYPHTLSIKTRDTSYELPDFDEVNEEMTRRKNMTLNYLWGKYNRECDVSGKKAYSYRQYCSLFSDWCDENDVSFTMPAYSGQSMEVDFAGNTFEMTDRLTGEIRTIVVFVAVLPYSNRTYAEGMISTKEPQWIEVNNHALDYFGGVPAIVVPDNCKQAVIANKDWIAPELNKDYEEWAEHNGTAILPAKVKKPRYKSHVEGAVGILEKGLFHILEERRYFSLQEFNQDLWEELEKLNAQPFKKKDHDRNYYWESEKQDLMPLPSVHYEYTERRRAKVSSDFHVRFDNAYYSVDKAYLHKDVLIRATAEMVRIYTVEGNFICEHKRASFKGQHMTDLSHLPRNYQNIRAWNGPYFMQQAASVGVNTAEVIKAVLASKKVEVQTYRQCMGILAYKDRYSKAVLEECCTRAVKGMRPNYSYIKNTISQVAEEMHVKPQNHAAHSKSAKGGICRSEKSYEIDTLLSKSRELLEEDGDPLQRNSNAGHSDKEVEA